MVLKDKSSYKSDDPLKPEIAVAAKGLGRRYGDQLALAGIDLSLGRGQTLAVFGHNGSGKSTLLKLLATLLRPSSGSLSVLGCSLPRDAQSLRSRVGYIGHEPLLYRELTPLENLSFFGKLYGVADVERRSRDLLNTVDVDRYIDAPVRTLSRGILQRVAVCRAVLHEPELLLLDEPYSHLDPHAALRVEPLIGRLEHSTRVLVSHDVTSSLREADLALCLVDARCTLFEETRSVGEDHITEQYGRSAQ